MYFKVNLTVLKRACLNVYFKCVREQSWKCTFLFHWYLIICNYIFFLNIYFYTTTAHSIQLITLPFHNWVVSVCILTQIHYDKNLWFTWLEMDSTLNLTVLSSWLLCLSIVYMNTAACIAVYTQLIPAVLMWHAYLLHSSLSFAFYLGWQCESQWHYMLVWASNSQPIIELLNWVIERQSTETVKSKVFWFHFSQNQWIVATIDPFTALYNWPCH